jgi:hypothetical protein
MSILEGIIWFVIAAVCAIAPFWKVNREDK